MQSIGRKKKSVVNTAIALVSQAATVLVGMMLPRALMTNYGSETNGLITSLQQIISYLTLLEGGLLSAVSVSLYKPLAQGDVAKVNEILAAAKCFYRKTGIVFCGALFFVAFVYPISIVDTQYSYWQLFCMVTLIGANGATQILFIGKYKALLMAAQLNGLILAINAASTVVYSLILIGAAYVHISVISGLAISIVAYLLRALVFWLATKKFLPMYNFNGNMGQISFPQRKDALTSQLLSMVSMNSGVVILSVLQASMELISVYTTFNLVLSCLYMLMYSVENSVTAAFGNLLASKPIDKVRTSYEEFDAVYHLLWTFVISCLAALLLPFVKMYTSGVEDIQYALPIESTLFVCVGALWMLRNQQTLLMTAKGAFKEMRKQMTVEAGIVVFFGVWLFLVCGLKGLLTAKLAATLYMLISLMRFSYSSILQTGISEKIKRIAVSCLCVGCVALIGNVVWKNVAHISLGLWIVGALGFALLTCTLVTMFWFLFLRNDLRNTIKVIKQIVK